MYIELLRTTTKGQLAAGRVTLQGSKIVYCDVSPETIRALREGVRLGSQLLQPQHGARFLRALPVLFNGSYLLARLVA